MRVADPALSPPWALALQANLNPLDIQCRAVLNLEKFINRVCYQYEYIVYIVFIQGYRAAQGIVK